MHLQTIYIHTVEELEDDNNNSMRTYYFFVSTCSLLPTGSHFFTDFLKDTSFNFPVLIKSTNKHLVTKRTQIRFDGEVFSGTVPGSIVIFLHEAHG